MKVKEVARTANVAWSPSGMQSIHLACGTVAQQLDATFSTNAKLEIFSLDLANPGPDTSLVGAISTPHRFHKLVWSGHGLDSEHPAGLIIGGSDNGIITIWSADRILKSNSDSSHSDCSIASLSQHTGAVRSLDVNPFQPNLLASGASESEIYIWDLNNPATPMSPGNKTTPMEDVSGVAWNRQVQHILASTSPGGRFVVWDLRKNEPIIQVADSNSRIQCSAIAWHPDVATQLVTSSGDDRSPVIQMWDLRNATAPMRTLEHHRRGVLSLAWCPQDSDLLLSASKDNCVYCWNPNSEVPGGEVVYELPSTSQWIFECQWCPRNPAIISTASFDGHVTMYSLLGGGCAGRQEGEDCSIMDAGSPALPSDGDFFDIVKPSSAKTSLCSSAVESAPLKTPPKWFRRPCGASFAFGGNLVSFSNTRGAGVPKTVCMSRVVTEIEFLNRSRDLEASLTQGKFAEFCKKKIAESSSTTDKTIWDFVKVTFEDAPRRHFLKLLGYDTEDLEKKFLTLSKQTPSVHTAGSLDMHELSQKLATIPPIEEDEREWEESHGTNTPANSDTSSNVAIFGSEGEGRASVFDTISLAESSTSSKGVPNTSALDIPAAPPSSMSSLMCIPTDQDPDSLLAQALLIGKFEAAVDICINADRMAEALVLAVAGGSGLLKKTQHVFFQKKPRKISKLISAVVNRNWTEIARHGNLENWRELLAALVTYAGPEEFSSLCDVLGNRLETEQDGQYSCHASLCYICSGNVDEFVECISKSSDDATVVRDDQSCLSDPLVLQDTMEKIVLLRKAVEKERRQWTQAPLNDTLNVKLQQYASLLASQGALQTAYGYLAQNTDSSCAVLKDRLYHAQGLTSEPRPEFPFSPVEVKPQTSPPHLPSTVPAIMSVGNEPAPIFNGTLTQGGANPYAHNCVPPPVLETMGSPAKFVGREMSSGLAASISVATNPADSVASYRQPDLNLPRMTSYGSEGGWNDPPLQANRVLPPAPNIAPITTPISAPITSPLQPDPNFQSKTTPIATPSGGDRAPLTQRVPATPAEAKVKEKLPIPQEFEVMVQLFEAMLARCRTADSTLGTRKKLEDIEKKLEVLCDMLRASKLSLNVIQGLVFMAEATQRQDYHSGLQCYNQMVSMGNFSELSGFLPGIKTLLNLGLKLKI